MNIQGKRRQLFKNTGIIAIGTLLSKILTFFLLPIYTSYLSTNSYGYVDLLQTIASLLIPIISLELYCAVFRFIIDEKKDDEINKILSTAFFINLIAIGLFICSVIVAWFFFEFKNPIEFGLYFISLMFFTSLQFTVRGYGNTKFYSFISFFNTLLSLVLNLIFIILFKFSAISILVALSISNILSAVIIIFKMHFIKKIKVSYFSKRVASKIVSYSLPLIPNDVSWWIANASDRLIISNFLNLSFNGIYAVANKIPAIYTTIFGVFNTAWIESVSRGINDDNSREFINDMYKKSFKLFSCICLGIICAMSLIFDFFIGKNYNDAYNHIYILTVAIFFSSLGSLIGSVLTGYKKTKVIGRTTIIGAAVNVIINVIFINRIGLYAASISTLISYVLILIVRNYEINKMQKLQYPLKYFPLLLFNFVLISIGYIYKIRILNIVLFIYLIIISIVINRELLGELLPIKKKNS